MKKLFLLFSLLGMLLIFAWLRFNLKTKPVQKPEAKAPEIKLTILEGWNVRDIDDYLTKQGLIKPGEFLKQEKTFNSTNFPALNYKPKSADLEGFLFPDTYRIYKPGPEAEVLIKNTDPSVQLIEKMLGNFSQKFNEGMIKQAQNKNMTVFDVLTLASIVEKETGHNVLTGGEQQKLDQERKIIAGIFYNRLAINMALESDATVNYVTGKGDSRPLLADTKINSPYNTYQNRGLPPGPICSPSLSSIMAVLYPEKSDYFYFLNDKQGRTYYAKTYEEHLKNKQKYLN